MNRSGSFSGQFSPANHGLPDAAGAVPPNANWTIRSNFGVMLHGEIHNIEALRQDLDLAAGLSPPDVLLAGWARWAERLLPRLDGVFALALRCGARLLLYRDPSGLRGLYVHAGPADKFSFGTDLNRLVRLPGVPCRLARASLHEYLRFGDIAPPRTIYDEVFSVEPGHLIWVSATGIATQVPQPPENGEPEPANFAHAIDQLDEYLNNSIASRLGGAKHPAAFLSGGVDSSLLCALAARQRPDLTTVTVGFEGDRFDESPIAARIAAHLGLTHEVLRFGRRDCLSGFERLAAGAEQPTADPATAVTVLAFEHCRHHFDAVLDGTGADEAVGLMPPRHVRLAVGYASLLSPALRAGLTKLLRSVPALASYTPLTDFEHPAETMMRWKGFARAEVQSLSGEDVSFEQTRFYRTYRAHPRFAHFKRYSALIDAMPCDRLSQATLLTGLPVRYPYCERATDHFIRQLRTEHRHLPGQPKRILRDLLARHVPRHIWDTAKHGFDFPLRDFLIADEYALVKEYLDDGFWMARGVLEPGLVRQYATRFIAGDMSLTFRVWMLVQLGAWLKEHGTIH